MTPAEITRHVVEATRASSDYSLIIRETEGDPELRALYFQSYAFERAKVAIGDAGATLDHRRPRPDVVGTRAYVCLATHGWRATVKVNLVTGEGDVIDDERRPSLRGAA
jgi:hypothetical protein